MANTEFFSKKKRMMIKKYIEKKRKILKQSIKKFQDFKTKSTGRAAQAVPPAAVPPAPKQDQVPMPVKKDEPIQTHPPLKELD